MNSLELALDKGIRTVAFPSISTGVYSYPLKEAAIIAATAVIDFVKVHPSEFNLIEWVCFDRNTLEAYSRLTVSFQVSANTLSMMDESVNNLKKGKASAAIDFSASKESD